MEQCRILFKNLTSGENTCGDGATFQTLLQGISVPMGTGRTETLYSISRFVTPKSDHNCDKKKKETCKNLNNCTNRSGKFVSEFTSTIFPPNRAENYSLSHCQVMWTMARFLKKKIHPSRWPCTVFIPLNVFLDHEVQFQRLLSVRMSPLPWNDEISYVPWSLRIT